MRIAIIGGTGLLGNATANLLLKRGIEVYLLSRNLPAIIQDGAHWNLVDKCDYKSLINILSKIRPDAIVDFASLLQHSCEASPSNAININVTGTLNVLESCRILNIPKLLFASSIAVYGERHDLMGEEDPIPVDLSLYGATKFLSETLGMRYQRLYGINFLALRYSGIFGLDSHQRSERSQGMAKIRQQILECSSGKDVQMSEVTGKERVHLTHVSEAANATCMALLAKQTDHNIYNIAGPLENYVSLEELYSSVSLLFPNAGKVIWSKKRAREAGPLDLSRFTRDFNFKPKVSILEGLKLEFGLN